MSTVTFTHDQFFAFCQLGVTDLLPRDKEGAGVYRVEARTDGREEWKRVEVVYPDGSVEVRSVVSVFPGYEC